MASTPDVGRAELQKQEARWQRDTEAKGMHGLCHQGNLGLSSRDLCLLAVWPQVSSLASLRLSFPTDKQRVMTGRSSWVVVKINR